MKKKKIFDEISNYYDDFTGLFWCFYEFFYSVLCGFHFIYHILCGFDFIYDLFNGFDDIYVIL